MSEDGGEVIEAMKALEARIAALEAGGASIHAEENWVMRQMRDAVKAIAEWPDWAKREAGINVGDSADDEAIGRAVREFLNVPGCWIDSLWNGHYKALSPTTSCTADSILGAIDGAREAEEG